MNLRQATVIGLGAFLVAQCLPTFGEGDEIDYGYVTLATAFATAGTFLTPDVLDLFSVGGSSFDRYVAMLAFSGSAANVSMVLAIVCGFCRMAGWTLAAALVASLNAGAALILMAWEEGPLNAQAGCLLWVGSMVWLSAAAAWSLRGERERVQSNTPPG